MLAAFSATIGVIAALFVGFLVFRFWRVTLALLILALIGVAGVIGYIFYEDARTARILAEQRARNERIDQASENQACGSLPNAKEVELCQIIVTASDRQKEEKIKAEAAWRGKEAAKAKAEREVAARAAAKAASNPNQTRAPFLPVPGYQKQSVEDWLKTLKPD